MMAPPVSRLPGSPTRRSWQAALVARLDGLDPARARAWVDLADVTTRVMLRILVLVLVVVAIWAASAAVADLHSIASQIGGVSSQISSGINGSGA